MIFGHGDDAYRYGKQIKIDFSSNVYYGADLSGLQAHLASRFGIVGHYPEPEPVSLEKILAEKLGVNPQMAYVIAAYHDTGLCEGREHHHEVSARIIRSDKMLRQWFTADEISLMADAAEDHRASSGHEPRSIYGRIVAEADRFIDTDTIIRRTIQYGIDHYPELSREEHFQRMVSHLREKYGRNGYLHLWFEDSPNAQRLRQLQDIIDDNAALRKLFCLLFPEQQ